ncbi:uncharacterized protein [Bemisia tabaci]|nr:PREDICTED: uncharacterized protein LOC109042773 [Bemisia tabaci]
MTESGKLLEVCKGFFLTTLGFKPTNDRFVHDTLKVQDKSTILPVFNDGRGKAPSVKRSPWELVDEHIESFHPVISHYRREHAPNMRYLPSDISISIMHADWKQKYPNTPICYETYRRQVKKKRISFAKLGLEECESCEEFKLHEHKDVNNLQENCDVCRSWKQHIDLANAARKLYRQHADNDFSTNGTVCFSADLQKIIMLPRVDMFKKVLFLQRLIAYHETFAPVGTKCKKIQPHAFIWNEAITGRLKEDIISIFYKFFLMQRDATKIIVWLDNCAGQNKNWALLSFLVFIINSTQISATEIHFIYFEPGHSFMSADSFHHQVELALKRQGKTYDFGDFASAVAAANNGKNLVIPMQHQEFFNWVDYASQAKLKNAAVRVYLKDIVYLKAVRGDFQLYYKSSYDGDFKTLDFLKKIAAKTDGMPVPSHLSRPRGFPSAKKEKILSELKGIIPDNRKKFWLDLPDVSAE